MTKSVLCLVTDGNEDIETFSTIDILRRADIHVDIVGTKGDCFITSHNVKVCTDTKLSSITSFEKYCAVVLPGGMEAAVSFSKDESVKKILKQFWESDKIVAAICASTMALKAAGIGKGMKATIYPALKKNVEDFYACREDRVVVDGQLVTSQGPATAIQFALKLVELIVGEQKSQIVANDILSK